MLKFFLHVSREEQKERLLERIRQPEKNWKFNPRDLEERQLWPEYQEAFEDALSETSTEWAPWHVIPPTTNGTRGLRSLTSSRRVWKKLDLQYPTVSEELRALYTQLGEKLASE